MVDGTCAPNEATRRDADGLMDGRQRTWRPSRGAPLEMCPDAAQVALNGHGRPSARALGWESKRLHTTNSCQPFAMFRVTAMAGILAALNGYKACCAGIAAGASCGHRIGPVHQWRGTCGVCQCALRLHEGQPVTACTGHWCALESRRAVVPLSIFPPVSLTNNV